MKLVFLNVWDAKVEEGVRAFVGKHSADTDVFCFQEAGDKMKHLCEQMLPNYVATSEYKYLNEQDYFSQLTCVRKSLEVERVRPLMKETPGTGLGIYTRVGSGDHALSVCNFHGVSKPGDKLDTPERLLQSREIMGFFEGVEGPKILGGDFNLDPSSDSVRMFEDSGYRNLIKEFNIRTTRNRLVWERHPGREQYFSDYVFVSPDVQVKDFSVEDIEISDHLPMILNVAV
jgi:endonuclease/exonuclease/phosphatase (EEP) superfamily protein YafD